MMEKNYNYEIRAIEEEDQKILEGYAGRFNSMSEDLGGFYELIDPRALDEAIKDDVRALYEHDYKNLLGRTSSETLNLSIDEQGLFIRLKLPNTPLGNNVYELTKRGDLNAMSFGFTVEKESYKKDEDKVIRTIEKIGQLFEVSIVSNPAYKATSATLRNLETFLSKDDFVAYHESIDKYLNIYEA